MPKNIVVDLNIIMDVFFERMGCDASRQIIKLGEAGTHRLHTSAHLVTTFGYLLEQAKVPSKAINQHIDWLLQTFHVVPTNSGSLQAALTSQIADYEDAVLANAAKVCHAEVIITRNIKDFRWAEVPAHTPEQYLLQL